MSTTNNTFIQTLFMIVSLCIGFMYPALPYIIIAIFLIIIDNISAYLCNRRIHKKYPNKCHDYKYSSAKASKTIKSIGYALFIIVASYLIEKCIVKDITDIHLTALVACLICAVQVLSILENITTENTDAPKWLKVLGKYLVSKAERYFDTDINDNKKIGE